MMMTLAENKALMSLETKKSDQQPIMPNKQQ